MGLLTFLQNRKWKLTAPIGGFYRLNGLEAYWSRDAEQTKKKLKPSQKREQLMFGDTIQEIYEKILNTDKKKCKERLARYFKEDELSDIQEVQLNDDIYQSVGPSVVFNSTTQPLVVNLSTNEIFVGNVYLRSSDALYMAKGLFFKISKPEVSESPSLFYGTTNGMTTTLLSLTDKDLPCKDFFSFSFGKLLMKTSKDKSLPTEVQLDDLVTNYYEKMCSNDNFFHARDLTLYFCEWLQVMFFRNDERNIPEEGIFSLTNDILSYSLDNLPPKLFYYCGNIYEKCTARSIADILFLFIEALKEKQKNKPLKTKEDLQQWKKELILKNMTWVDAFLSFCNDLSLCSYPMSSFVKNLTDLPLRENCETNKRPSKAEAIENRKIVREYLDLNSVAEPISADDSLSDIIDKKFGPNLQNLKQFGKRFVGLAQKKGTLKATGRQKMKIQKEKDPLQIEEKLRLLLDCNDDDTCTYTNEIVIKTDNTSNTDQDLHADLGMKKENESPNQSELKRRHYLVWAPLSPQGASLKIKPHGIEKACYIFIPKGSFIVFDGALEHAGVSWENMDMSSSIVRMEE